MKRLGTVLLLAAAGCASVAKERGHDEVDRLVRERSGHQTRWAQGSPADADVDRWLGQSRRGETVDRAIGQLAAAGAAC